MAVAIVVLANVSLLLPQEGSLGMQVTAGISRRLLIVCPLLALVVAATLSRVFLGHGLRREDHLAGRTPNSRSATTAATGAIFLPALAIVGVCISLFVAWIIDLGSTHTRVFSSVDEAGSTISLVLAVTVVPAGWALIMLGLTSVASPRASFVLCVVAVVASGSLRLLAMRYTAAQPIYDFSPAGVARSLITTEVMTGSASLERRWTSGFIFLAWSALGYVILMTRGRIETFRSSAGAAAQRRRRTTPFALLGTSVAVAALAAGLTLPNRLAAAVPWHLKAEWRADVVDGATPADRAIELLGQIDDRSRAEASNLVGFHLTKTQYELLLSGAAHGEEPRNDTDAPVPGTVVVDLGQPHTDESGFIEDPDQVDLCYEATTDDWRLRDVRLNNVCEARGQ